MLRLNITIIVADADIETQTITLNFMRESINTVHYIIVVSSRNSVITVFNYICRYWLFIVIVYC